MKKTLFTLALLAAAVGANANPVAQPAKVAAPAASATATVNVSGATTVSGAPLLLAVHGGHAVEPTFQQLFEAGQANPKWKVTQVTPQGAKARVSLKSVTSADTIEMDVAAKMATDLKVKKDAIIELETQSSGQGALIKFSKDNTALGFMVNRGTTVNVQPRK